MSTAQTPKKLLSGIVVPTITPLRADGQLDEPALRALLGHLLRSRVSGLFVAGTTGEGPALSLSTRRRAVEVSCDVAAGKIPVVVAALETGVAEILQTAAHARGCGADAVAIAPPFYLSLDEDDTVRAAEMVDGEAELPAYLYNVPFANLPQFSLSAIRRLAGRQRILGLKDSSGDFAQLRAAIEIYRERAECSVLVGPESLLAAALRAGADGGVCGGANLFPTLYADLYDAAQRSDEEALDTLQRRVLQVEQDFYHVGAASNSLVRGLKTALSLLGIGEPTLVTPYPPATAEERQGVEERLKRWTDIVPGHADPDR